MLKHKALRDVSNRLDLLNLINELSIDGCGAELGVATGSYSDTILRVTKLKLFSIDRWSGDRDHGSRQHQKAVDALNKYGNRSVIIKKTFHEAVIQFQDSSFDFIYIDGYAHTGQDDGEILTDWWPKLKANGIFSGHDYDIRWPKTMVVVNEFCRSQDLYLYITSNQDRYRSWFTIKQ